MKIKDAFIKLKNILKTKTAIRIISIALVLLAIFSAVMITLAFVKDDEIETHTVAFDTSGGSSIAAVEVEHGERVSAPRNPIKDGYVFDGWYVHGIPWNFDMNVVRESIVMRAKWLEAVTVTFDTGEQIIDVPIAKGAPIRESDLPKTYRDDLCGWYVGGLKWDLATPVTEPVRLNAGYLSALMLGGDPSALLDACKSLGITLTRADNSDVVISSGAAPADAIDLSAHIEYLPHFSAFLKKNPTLSAYLNSQGGLFCAPKPLPNNAYSLYANSDWVKILLDGVDFENENADTVENTLYMPHVSDCVLRVAIEANGEISYITKRLDIAGNIVATMNSYGAIGGLDGERAVKYLRKYIDDAYSGHFEDERSKLFIGDSALYDTDELVALLRVAAANHSVLGEDKIFGIYVDACDMAAVISLIAELFGLESVSTELPKISISAGEIKYNGSDEQMKYAVREFNRMISEELVTFDGEATALMRYESLASEEYTEILSAVSRKSDTNDDVPEYVRATDTLECDLLYSLSLCTSVRSSREKLMAALRLIDAMYINR